VNITNILLVALGGAAGSVLRHGVGIWLKPVTDVDFPVSTLLINLVGSFLIGALAGTAMRDGGWMNSTGWPLLAIGVCGGFTTFSAFSLEGLRMLQSGALGPALLYLGGSVVGSLALCALGLRLTP
jgi:CrcB protein